MSSNTSIFASSIDQCHCYAWNYPKPIHKDVPMCTFYGNDCFYSKFTNSSYKLTSCNCLPSCSEVKYKYVIDSNRKFSDVEISELCEMYSPHYFYVEQEIEEHYYVSRFNNLSADSNLGFGISRKSHEMCKQYIKNEYSRVTVRIEGSSFLRRTATLKYNLSDKVAVIGGTLGLFSGFSVLVLFETIFWAIVTLKKSVSNANTPKDPVEYLSEKVVALSDQNEAILKENKRMQEKMETVEKSLTTMLHEKLQKESTTTQLLIVEDVE